MLDLSKMLESEGAAAERTEGVSTEETSPLDLKAAQRSLKRFEGELDRIKKQAEVLVIDDDPTFALATEMRAQVRNLIAAIETKRKELTEEPYQFKKRVDSFAKRYRDILDGIDRKITGKQNDHAYKKELQRREAEREAREAAEAKQRELDAQAKAAKVEPVKLPDIVVPKKTDPVRTESGSATVKMVWTYEVVDWAAVPRDYLERLAKLSTEPQQNKVFGAAIDAGIREIAGVKIFERAETRVRRF